MMSQNLKKKNSEGGMSHLLVHKIIVLHAKPKILYETLPILNGHSINITDSAFPPVQGGRIDVRGKMPPPPPPHTPLLPPHY